MGKLIVPLIIGLLMGLSGGGFFSVYKASAAHATAVADAKKHGLKPAGDSTHAGGDSTAHATDGHPEAEVVAAASHDSSRAPAAEASKPGETTKPAEGTKPVAAAHALAPDAAHATPVAETKPGVTAASAAPDAETKAHQQRLAKIFATMGPKDASRVLAQMTDHDVGIILALLSNRQAAAILTQLPAPRAAALSQVQPRRSEP